MKKIYFTIAIASFILFRTNGIYAQNLQNKLDQVELMKQFIGLWEGQIDKNTRMIGDNKLFGTGLECDIRIIANGKNLDSVKQLSGYDKRTDKYIITELMKSSPEIEMSATWFTSDTKGELVLLQDISGPESAEIKWKFEFTSPDSIIQTATRNNKVVKIIKLTRIKSSGI